MFAIQTSVVTLTLVLLLDQLVEHDLQHGHQLRLVNYLIIFKAKDLLKVDWSGASKDVLPPKYYNHPSFPADSGFVAVLAHMKDLMELVSEVGARSVASLAKYSQKPGRQRKGKFVLNLWATAG
jgi:hypothetical protein